MRRAKWEEIIAKKRGIGGKNAPVLTCILPLNGQLDSKSAIAMLTTCQEDATVTYSPNGVVHIRYLLKYIFLLCYFVLI